ncbi:MAG: hypothetical protein V8R00_06605 [Coprococcus catus]
MIKHIWAVYFSPSGKTEQVTMAVAEGAAGVLKIGEIHRMILRFRTRESIRFALGRKIWLFWDVRRMPDEFRTKSCLLFVTEFADMALQLRL